MFLDSLDDRGDLFTHTRADLYTRTWIDQTNLTIKSGKSPHAESDFIHQRPMALPPAQTPMPHNSKYIPPAV